MTDENTINPKPGRGRPEGRNAYGEATIPVRIPKSKITVVKDYLKHCALSNNLDPIDKNLIEPIAVPDIKVRLPLYSSKVSAGFPSPADDHVEKRLNIHDYLIDQEASTFMVTVAGESMRDAGLLPKDVAIVDRSKIPAIGNIVLAVVDGEFTIKQLSKTDEGNPLLLPANPDYQPIEIQEGMDFEIWGVITGLARKYL
jgi:DNA polymerase V